MRCASFRRAYGVSGRSLDSGQDCAAAALKRTPKAATAAAVVVGNRFIVMN